VSVSGSSNLILDNQGCPGNTPSPGDPRLGALRGNGDGQTPTLPIGTDSPAYDTGDDAHCETIDQRGLARPQSQHCDIGAHESAVPVAKCKAVTVSAGASCLAAASVNDGSYDPEGGTITLTQDPPGPYALGTRSVTLTASNASGQSSCTANVTVADTTGPTITVKPTLMLVDNNHKYRSLVASTLVGSVADNCSSSSASDVVVRLVTSDERDDAPTAGDGATTRDIVIPPDCRSVMLRQERDGDRNGRVYRITLQAKDGAGNVGAGVARVDIPLSATKPRAAVDSGVALTVQGCTP
jgi:hypothetical protein